MRDPADPGGLQLRPRVSARPQPGISCGRGFLCVGEDASTRACGQSCGPLPARRGGVIASPAANYLSSRRLLIGNLVFYCSENGWG